MTRPELPQAYAERMRSLLGEEYAAYEKTYEQPVRQGMRLNRRKITAEKWEQIRPFLGEKIPWVANGYYIENGQEELPSRHPYYFAGLYYLQEPSAMTPASRLPIREGDYVLDLCAAPGGKATELAGRLAGSGLLLANDLSSSRAKALLKNLELTGAANIYVSSETPQKLAENLPEFFDKVLIDAPCSGEGMFHKEPKMIQYWEEQPPSYYAKIQKELILLGTRMLRPGGMLLYSTCTFSPEENEEVIADLLEQNPDMALVPIESYSGFSPGFPIRGASEERNRALKNCVRIFPHKMPGEGHFLALLQKKGTAGNRKEKASPSAALPACAEEFLKLVKLDFSQGIFQLEREKLYFLPGKSRLPKLRYLRTGLYLGEVKKNRFEPSQALAMALSPETFASCVELDSRDLRTVKYLKGETLDVSDLVRPGQKGWQLVCTDGYALGFGKLSGGSLKNKYYPGWRLQ